MENFDSKKLRLEDVLTDVRNAKIQLPDFQRDWVWNEEGIKSLLASIGRSFPIGTLMLLQQGGECNFHPRLVEGVDKPKDKAKIDSLILDGQQRLTALTQALILKKPVHTRTARGKKKKCYYYFDIQKALEGSASLEDSIFMVDEKRTYKDFSMSFELDLSTKDGEYASLCFPCNEIFDISELLKWPNHVPEDKRDIFSKFTETIVKNFLDYQIPVIELNNENKREAVCLVFEKVNTGGVSLNVFEILTAMYAGKKFKLRDDWFGRRERMESKCPLLGGLEASDFLQSVTMLATQKQRQKDTNEGKTGKARAAVSAKRASILELPLASYEVWANRAEEGFIEAGKFLNRQTIESVRDLPYRSQLAPLASILAYLELLDGQWLQPVIYEKLCRWYWCGVFGELYGGQVETTIANDLEDMVLWLGDKQRDDEPRTIKKAIFSKERLDSLTSNRSAAYKGVSALLLAKEARDFFYKETVQGLDSIEVSLDIHHIFPKAWCIERKIPKKRYDTIINKTPISKKANRIIGGSKPSDYLKRLQEQEKVRLDEKAMDDILLSHRIPVEELRADDFDAFYDARKKNLIQLIEDAMDKPSVTQETA